MVNKSDTYKQDNLSHNKWIIQSNLNVHGYFVYDWVNGKYQEKIKKWESHRIILIQVQPKYIFLNRSPVAMTWHFWHKIKIRTTHVNSGSTFDSCIGVHTNTWSLIFLNIKCPGETWAETGVNINHFRNTLLSTTKEICNYHRLKVKVG